MNIEAVLTKIQNFSHGELTKVYKESFIAAATDIIESETGEGQFFWNFLKKVDLKVHSSFFEDFNLQDGFQIVDQFGRQTYFSFNIAKQLKFDLDHVLQTPFDELFERDPFITKRVMDTFIQMMTSTKKEVFDLTAIPKHLVKQKGFPDDSYFVSFKKAYPVYFNNGEFYGFVLRLDVNLLKN